MTYSISCDILIPVLIIIKGGYKVELRQIKRVSGESLRKAVQAKVPVIFLQGHGDEKSYMIILKAYYKRNQAEIKKLKQTIHMTQLSARLKKNLLGADLCGEVEAYEVDPACLTTLNTQGIEDWVKENRLTSGCLASMQVAPV